MHAYCLTGGTKEARIAEIQKRCDDRTISSFDRRVVNPDEKQSIKIDAIRQWVHSLQLTTSSGSIAGIIWDAHTMTHEAQQALLKTFEEPPPNTILFLETATPQSLLPTILSRVTKIIIHNEATKENEQTIEAMTLLTDCVSLSKSDCVRRIETAVPKKENAKEWIELLLATLSTQKNSLFTESQRARLITSLLDAKKALHVNVSHTFVCERICFANPLDKLKTIA